MPGRPGEPAGWPIPPGRCGRGRCGRPCRPRVVPGGVRGRGRGSRRKCTKYRRLGGSRGEALSERRRRPGPAGNLPGAPWYDPGPAGEWRNWQTRRIQVPVGESLWGFESPLAHLDVIPAGAPAPPAPVPRGAGRPDRDRGGGLCRHPGAVGATDAPGVSRSGAVVRRRRGGPRRPTGRHGAAARADRPSRHGVHPRRTAGGTAAVARDLEGLEEPPGELGADDELPGDRRRPLARRHQPRPAGAHRPERDGQRTRTPWTCCSRGSWTWGWETAPSRSSWTASTRRSSPPWASSSPPWPSFPPGASRCSTPRAWPSG